MKKITELFGKPVISLYDGTLEGYVKNVLFDDKLSKLTFLEVFDNENEDEKILDANNIFCMDNDAIMIKNNERVFLKDTLSINGINPINFQIFSPDGKLINKITDLELEGLKVKFIYLDNEDKLDKKEILSIGKKIIIKKGEKEIKISAFKPRAKIVLDKSFDSIKVSMQNENSKVEVTTIPKKIVTGNYNFLLGRKINKNIYAENKQLIAKKQSKITSQIIDIASQNGKLKDLTNSSIA